MQNSTTELRREPRQIMIGDVRYSETSMSANGTERHYKGMLFDLSPSGLCIFTHKPIAPGVELRLYDTRLWDESRYAVVKWCKQISADIYRVGLSFIPSA